MKNEEKRSDKTSLTATWIFRMCHKIFLEKMYKYKHSQTNLKTRLLSKQLSSAYPLSPSMLFPSMFIKAIFICLCETSILKNQVKIDDFIILNANFISFNAKEGYVTKMEIMGRGDQRPSTSSYKTVCVTV